MNLNTIFLTSVERYQIIYIVVMLNPRILLGFLRITTPNYNLEWSINVTPENTTTFGLDEPQNNIINMTAIFLQSIGVMKI
jgi:hypothetical protein